MPDTEKVTKGLEHCLSRYVDGLCDDCPYMGELDKSYMIPMKCKEIIMRDALSLLKEQEAKPVEVCGQMFTIKYGHCPTCGKGIDSDTYPHWCGFCGQAVKWRKWNDL